MRRGMLQIDLARRVGIKAQSISRMEKNFDNGRKMALLEELKTFPLGAVYDYFCEQQSIPSGIDFIPEIDKYEKTVLSARK